MERGPAVFAAVVFLLYGTALLAWTGACARRGAPVAEGVRPSLALPAALLGAAASLALGAWCLAHV
ncbi:MULTISPECIES: hypothetical protein [Streptomyces]|uniref:hypothetical protein n=1 Tax=Streptomyces TaxID=1883 RepID=UPI0016761DFE|nr:MULTISPECIES: hypothetical protein [Streptomyces]MBD3575123.1 hypothetical protein [Streptomyces sp. KD18]GGT16575.1 hypothetical protein GCM10010286_47710 [Streptomyces toxytricini]